MQDPTPSTPGATGSEITPSCLIQEKNLTLSINYETLRQIVWLPAGIIATLYSQELYILNEAVYISDQDTVAVIGAPPGDPHVDGTGIIENDGGIVWLTVDWINTSAGDGFVTPAMAGFIS